jgi:hypothetical protein
MAVLKDSRALRIAKETADKSAAVGEGPVSKKSVTKKSVKSTGRLRHQRRR